MVILFIVDFLVIMVLFYLISLMCFWEWSRVWGWMGCVLGGGDG